MSRILTMTICIGLEKSILSMYEESDITNAKLKYEF